MKIPLSYITQIRGSDQAGAIIEGRTSEERALGGWIALSENEIVASVAAGYHTEHHDNDTHSIIHCDSIAERSRTTAMGVWINAGTSDATAFTTSSAAVWTVPIAGQDISYTLIGTTMLLNVRLDSTSINAATAAHLMMRIPGGFTVKRSAGSACVLYDNSAAIAVGGLIRVLAGGTVVDMNRLDGAPFGVSVANTSLNAQIAFEVQ